jgi:hypothetical protein
MGLEIIYKNYFDNLKSYTNIRTFFSILEKYGDLIIIGGALRDIHENKEPRDIDIILKENINFDWQELNTFNFVKNRFGGAKLKIDKTEIDFWLLKDNWANKNNFIKNSVKELRKGTFFNIDSLIFNYSNNEMYIDVYEECLKNKEIDIILKGNPKYIENNPTPEINIIRAFYNSQKYDLKLSLEVKKYISGWLRKNSNFPEKKLKTYEKKHYKNKEIFKEDEYKKMLKKM